MATADAFMDLIPLLAYISVSNRASAIWNPAHSLPVLRFNSMAAPWWILPCLLGQENSDVVALSLADPAPRFPPPSHQAVACTPCVSRIRTPRRSRPAQRHHQH